MKKTSKTILLALLVLIIVVALVACQKPFEIQTQNPDGTLTVAGILIEQAVTTVARLLLYRSLRKSPMMESSPGRKSMTSIQFCWKR